MKLYYDNEMNVFDELHYLQKNECLIISDRENSISYKRTAKIIDDIIEGKSLHNWVNNSSSSNPPDLINDKDGLMMEIMRIDDHSPDGKVNPHLAKQRRLSKELEAFMEQFPKDTKLIINSVTDLPTEEDHNYKNYYSSFERTVKKHLSKIERYKKNFPNKKMIFLVLDETSGAYFERINSSVFNIGRPHLWFCDNRFLESFIDSNIDYLIWYKPFQLINTNQGMLDLPKLAIFDIQNVHKGNCLVRINYNQNKMVSTEK